MSQYKNLNTKIPNSHLYIRCPLTTKSLMLSKNSMNKMMKKLKKVQKWWKKMVWAHIKLWFLSQHKVKKMKKVKVQVKIKMKMIMNKKRLLKWDEQKLSAKTQNGRLKMKKNIGNSSFITRLPTLIWKFHGPSGKTTQFTKKWENLLKSCLDSANQKIKTWKKNI